MSLEPLKYVDEFCKYSDVIYFHNEINEDKKLIKNAIINKGKKPGIVIHASKNYKDIDSIIKNYDEILLLCVEHPGTSGQKF